MRRLLCLRFKARQPLQAPLWVNPAWRVRNNGRNAVVKAAGGSELGNNGRNAVVKAAGGSELGNNGRNAVVKAAGGRELETTAEMPLFWSSDLLR
ncbi:hypothetical protein [Paenibacillus jilunlii]|uniref:Uncharacterized protein n=1 Tax=Paenibacillus jilunlii TaxID=682956 RepID=A0A1G9QYG0_9BACL|nr:hypothetical protein [Paenibacillus jilunlii]KWX77262.1 hypothetical protein AML91_08090 [Paenibacillus jilunlii]SDM15901.1 hypothetical protein SAMN05216191_109186 [Paenibacillus jilunlii]